MNQRTRLFPGRAMVCACAVLLAHFLQILPACGGSQDTTAPTRGPRLSIPFISGYEGYQTFRIPAIIAVGRGRLLAVCEGRKNSASDSGDVDVVFKHSDDGGRTWGPLGVIWDDSTNTCGNPCLVRDAETGVVWILLTWNRGEDHESGIINQTSRDSRRVFASSSGDDGRTWSRPREITPDVKLTNWTWYATGPGAGIQLQQGLHKGRLVIPCDHIEAGTKRYFSHVIYSDDKGRTWKLGGTTPRDQVNECEVVELADGALMLNMRSYDPSKKARQSAISRNGGLTWEEQRVVPELADPICQASIRRLSWPQDTKPGVILFANAASLRREKMTVRASFDDGRSWTASRLITAQPSAYSCLVPMPDDAIGLLYETGARNPYEAIVFAVFNFDWLTEESRQ